MTEDEARARDPTATRLEWTKEIRRMLSPIEAAPWEAFDPYDPKWTL